MRQPVRIFLPLDAHGFGAIEVCASKHGVAIEARLEQDASFATTYLTAAQAVEFLTKAINLIVDECVQ